MLDVSSANPTLNKLPPLPPIPSISLAIDLKPPVMELAIDPVKSFAIWVATSAKIFLIVSPKSSNLPVKTLKSVSSIFFSKVSNAMFIYRIVRSVFCLYLSFSNAIRRFIRSILSLSIADNWLFSFSRLLIASRCRIFSSSRSFSLPRSVTSAISFCISSKLCILEKSLLA